MQPGEHDNQDEPDTGVYSCGCTLDYQPPEVNGALGLSLRLQGEAGGPRIGDIHLAEPDGGPRKMHFYLGGEQWETAVETIDS